MEIQILNGLSRVTPDDDPYMQGFSRMNVQLDGYSLNNYSLNGYTLNGDEIDDVEEYCLEMQQAGRMPTLNGYMNGRAERRARRAKRRARREGRKEGRARRREAKTRRKELRPERREQRMLRKWKRLELKEGRKAGRAERRARRAAMAQETLAKASDIGQQLLKRKVGDIIPTDEIISDFAGEEEFYEGAPAERLFGKPKLFKEPGKWFASDRIPTIQKVGVAAAGVIIVDQLAFGGKLMSKLKGKKKGA